MLLKNQGPNQSELILENGSHILFSYDQRLMVCLLRVNGTAQPQQSILTNGVKALVESRKYHKKIS